MDLDRRKRNDAVVILCAALVAAACSSGGAQRADSGSVDVPPADGPGTVSFVNDVYPIVAASCAVTGCHDMGITMNHWTDYTTAEKTYMRWVNGPGFDFCVDGPVGQFQMRTIVMPGDPDGSYLVTKIAPPTEEPCQDPTHHRRMPPDPREPLSAEAIATIVQWISEGALQN
jgi:hypothetical protein